MKRIVLILFLFIIGSLGIKAQEKYGKTANLGVGVGYYGYIGKSVPALYFNYEFDVAKNMTIAPFVGFYAYRNQYRQGNPNNYYWYRQTVIPVGAKGTYYFDEILDAGSDWDFYLGASLGFAFVHNSWSNNYPFDRVINGGASPLYLDAHLGAEYHLNSKIGLFLDLSSGVSTFGIAIHN